MSLTRRGAKLQAEAQGPKGRKREVGYLGREAATPPPTNQVARRSGGCNLPQRVRGGASENLKFGATWDLKIHYRNAL